MALQKSSKGCVAASLLWSPADFVVAGVQRRFAKTMNAYCQGALVQVLDYSTGRTPSLEEMVLTRRLSAGVSPLYHLVEYAHGIEMPDEVFEHPVIQELEYLGIDLVSM
jgi:Terpene synthase family 2, C-terminal metal binding